MNPRAELLIAASESDKRENMDIKSRNSEDEALSITSILASSTDSCENLDEHLHKQVSKGSLEEAPKKKKNRNEVVIP